MKDLTTMSLAEILEKGVPKDDEVPDGQRATALVLQSLLPHLAEEARAGGAGGGDLALGWRKWGAPFARDLAAYATFDAMKTEADTVPGARARLLERTGAPPDVNVSVIIGPAVGLLMKEVDFAVVERIMEEGWMAHRAARRSLGRDKSIASEIAGLGYGLAMKGLPNVRVPGDLYDQMTGDWRGKRPKAELS